jgi:hypothetical protein
VLKLWYPWMTSEELTSLVEAAPSANTPEDTLLSGAASWHAENLSTIQKEFASIDVSGDGSVDRWVRSNTIAE